MVSRLHKHYDPVVATNRNVEEGRDIVEKIRQLLVRNEESVSHVDNAEKFWRVRRSLDNELKFLLSEVQESWLDDLHPLFMPFDPTYPKGMLPALRELDDKFCGAGFREQHAAVLTRSLDKLGVGGSQRWTGLMRSLARQDGVEGDIAKKIASMWGALREKLLKGAGGKQASAKRVASARPYVLLVVPPVGLHSYILRLINANWIPGPELHPLGVPAPLRRGAGDPSAFLPHVRESSTRDQRRKP